MTDILNSAVAMLSIPTPTTFIAITAIASSVLMIVLWLIQIRSGDAGIADVGWAGGLAVAVVLYALFATGDPLRRTLLAMMAGIWGARLALYILINRVLQGEEDGRYARMRRYWGERANRGFFWFYQAQALFIVIFAVPMALVAFNPSSSLGVWDGLAIMIWLVSMGGEWLADKQLADFRANPDNSGKTCRVGLWKTSRHPNYFFEWLHWWTYVFLGVGSPYWALTLMGPLMMLIFLFKITGIPYTEQQAISKRGDDYREYQRTTSMFIPWFPKAQ